MKIKLEQAEKIWLIFQDRYADGAPLTEDAIEECAFDVHDDMEIFRIRDTFCELLNDGSFEFELRFHHDETVPY